MRALLLFVLVVILSSSPCDGQRQYPTLTFLNPSFPRLSSVAVDSTGYIYVLNGSTVVEYNVPRSVMWSIELTAPLRRATAIKVDLAGWIYVTDREHGAVFVFDSEGDQLAMYDGLSGAGNDGKPLTPAGLAFDRSGALYVVDQRSSRVVVFDGYGNVTRYLDVPRRGSRSLLIDVVVDALGAVYVSDFGESSVIVLSSQNNTMVAEWFSDIYQPLGLTIDSSNMVYVASAMNTTSVFNTAGQLLWQQSYYSYQLAPHWLAVNSAGQLFVGDTAHSTVGILSGLVLPGSVLSVISGQNRPLAVAVSNSSLLLVVNSLPTNIEAIQLYVTHSDACTFVRAVRLCHIPSHLAHHHSVLPVSLCVERRYAYNYNYYMYQLTTVNATQPFSVAVSNAGNFACQTDNAVVNCYNINGYPSGRLVSTIQLQPGQYSSVSAVAVAIDDVQLLIYVVSCYVQASWPDSRVWNIEVFNWAGQLVETLDYGLNNPTAIAVSPLNAALYIADGSNGRIVVANRQGTQLHSYTGFQQPFGVAVDSQNSIYIADIGTNQLIILDYRGNRLYTIEHGFNGLRSVAVDKLNRIILADSNNNRLVILQGISNTLQRYEQDQVESQSVEGKDGMQDKKTRLAE